MLRDILGGLDVLHDVTARDGDDQPKEWDAVEPHSKYLPTVYTTVLLLHG
jgi:hypothetical protein